MLKATVWNNGVLLGHRLKSDTSQCNTSSTYCTTRVQYYALYYKLTATRHGLQHYDSNYKRKLQNERYARAMDLNAFSNDTALWLWYTTVLIVYRNRNSTNFTWKQWVRNSVSRHAMKYCLKFTRVIQSNTLPWILQVQWSCAKHPSKLEGKYCSYMCRDVNTGVRKSTLLRLFVLRVKIYRYITYFACAWM